MRARYAVIYVLADPLTGGVRYVGRTVNPTQRLIAHRSSARYGSHYPVHRWIASIGRSPTMQVMEAVPLNEIAAAERFWVAYLRFVGCNLLNLTDGGDTVSNTSRRPKSAEHKAKIAASNRATKRGLNPARRAPHGRKPMSDETREKIRQAQIRYRATEEARTRSAAPRRPHSSETKAKIGARSRGRQHTPEFRERMSAKMREIRAARRGNWGGRGYVKQINNAGSYRV